MTFFKANRIKIRQNLLILRSNLQIGVFALENKKLIYGLYVINEVYFLPSFSSLLNQSAVKHRLFTLNRMSFKNCSINYCLNNGQCFSHDEGNNSWWCKCPPCTSGSDCGLNNNILFKNPPDVMKLMVQESSPINYRVLLLLCTIFLMIVGLLNNCLALSTFLNSKVIRSSYNGVYLVSLSICGVYVMIFVGARYILTLYGSKSIFESYFYQYLYNCYVGVRINAILIAACM